MLRRDESSLSTGTGNRLIDKVKGGTWMMVKIINLIPGVLAATAGFFALLLMNLLGFQSNWLRFLGFIVVYIVANVALDKAMTAYGKK